MAIPIDPKQYAAPKPQGTKGGKKKTATMTYIDPLAGVPSAKSLGLTDTSQFVTQLQGLAAQAANVKPVNYGAYHPQAATWAGQDIAAQVNPLRTQQQQLLSTGRQQAGLINQAGLSAAAFTEPWAQGVRDTYLGLGDRQLQLAQGLTGATRDAALDDASAYNARMAGIGSPQTIDGTRAAALSNALNGLGGLGADTLWKQAAAAYTGAQGVPQQMLGYAQAQAAGTLGAATQKAAEINPQIANIRATRGKLTREYQQDLFTNAQTTQDFKLKTLAMRSDIINSVGAMANASNDQKLKFAQFQQTATEAHNAIVTANRNYAIDMRRINQDWKIAKLTDANADADRTAQIKIASDNRAAETARANNALEVSWADTKGWYTDAQGRPHATPGNRLVIDPKTGKISAVEIPSPSERVALKSASSAIDTARGWQWVNGKRVALPGKKLVFSKDGKFLGAQRDPGQYATGSAGSTSLDATRVAKLASAVEDNIDDWVFGAPPDDANLEHDPLTGKSRIPGIDPRTGQLYGAAGTPERAAAQRLYQSAGGTQALTYGEILRKIHAKAPGIYNEAAARSLVDQYYVSRGENPRYAETFNLPVGYSLLQRDAKGALATSGGAAQLSPGMGTPITPGVRTYGGR